MNLVQMQPKFVGKCALVPGPKERADAIVQKMKNPVKISFYGIHDVYGSV